MPGGGSDTFEGESRPRRQGEFAEGVLSVSMAALCLCLLYCLLVGEGGCGGNGETRQGNRQGESKTIFSP